MIKLSKGRQQKALKVVVYGPEGIGKSTFASKFPAPIFIDTEGSTGRMDVVRVDPAPKSWTELKEAVRLLSQAPYVTGYQTLVIDTADWAEKMCAKGVCDARGVKGIEDFGYGKGYTYLEEEFGKLLDLLTEIVDKGNNVVVTAHAAMRKFEQPDELGAYDRWELKLQKKTAPLLKEWADAVFFANYKTIVVNVDDKGAAKGKNKVQGGRRVMFTSHHPCWDAKNRFDLAEELPFDYASIAHIVPAVSEGYDELVNAPASEPQKAPSAAPAAEAKETAAPPVSAPERPQEVDEPVPEELRRLMEMSGVTAREVREVVAKVGYFPADTPIMNYGSDFIMGMLVADWKVVEGMILQMRNETPF